MYTFVLLRKVDNSSNFAFLSVRKSEEKVYVSKALFANKLDLLSLVDRVTASQFLSISHLIHHYRILNWGFSSN